MENVTALSQGEWRINNCQEFNKDLVQPLYRVVAPLPASLRADIEQQSRAHSHMVLFNLMYSGHCKKNANQKEILFLLLLTKAV